MQRADFQLLAAERLADAEGLLSLGRWAGAYYLAGYAIECGLKARVLTHLASDLGVIFRNRRFSERCWTHDLEELLELAGLKSVLQASAAANSVFAANWKAVVEWSEQSRYETRDEVSAREIVAAVGDPGDGVLAWIRKHW